MGPYIRNHKNIIKFLPKILIIITLLILIINIVNTTPSNDINYSYKNQPIRSSSTFGVGDPLNVHAYADSKNLSQTISILYNASVITWGYVDQGLCLGFAGNGSSLNYDYLGGEAYFSTAAGFPKEGQIDGSGFQHWTKWTYHKEGDWDVLNSELQYEDYMVYYFAFVIINRNPRNVVMSVGSDDGIKIWQNGNLIHNNNAYRPIQTDQDQIQEVGSGQNITNLIQCLGYDTTAKINLAGGWSAYHLYSRIYNLTDYNHWESNGEFSGSISPWSTSVYDPAGTSAVYSVSYASGTGNPAGSVYFRMYVDSTFSGTHMEIRQVLYILECMSILLSQVPTLMQMSTQNALKRPLL
ncbi:MAG: hypothetical protein ACTSRP_26365 [Candidatus Helarchaeota archaeon]